MISATINNQPLVFEYTRMQEAVFLNSTAKYVVCSAGRRCGKSRGMAQYFLELLLDSSEQNEILWIDLVYSQIQNYYERYFLPHLLKLNKELWNWNAQKKELRVLNNKLSFRSCDRPDLLVGLSYRYIAINEAGIATYEDPTLLSQIIMPMMLDYPDSRLWLIGTPRGTLGKDSKDNVFYAYFKRGQEGDPKVESYEFSSYDNPFLKEDDIKELEDEVPAQLRLQELYAKFLNVSELQVFNPEWWKIVKEGPRLPEIATKFISIDTAFGTKTVNDESAATVWIKTYSGKYYCIDCWHDRLDYPSLVIKMKELCEKHHPYYLLVEAKASGQSLIQTIKIDLPAMPVKSFEPNRDKINDNYDTDKVSRAVSVSSIIENGDVFLLEGPWNKEFINQCTVFPLGSHDDIVDTLSAALIHSRSSELNIKQILSRKVTIRPINGYGSSGSLIKNFYNNEE